MDVKVQAAIVTGGASGIGFAVSERLASEGARVSVWDRENLPAGASGAIEALRLDVTDAAAVDEAARRTADAMGGIDILVCSAAITGPNATTWDYPVEDWKKVFDINVHGVFHCNRAVVPAMCQQLRWTHRKINTCSSATSRKAKT